MPWQQFRDLDQAPADRDVEAFRNQVDLAAIEMPIGSDARIPVEKFWQRGKDIAHGEGEAHAHFQDADWLALDLRGAVDRALKIGKAVADALQEGFALFCQGQLACRAME